MIVWLTVTDIPSTCTEVIIKVMLHGTIRNDDFLRNTALQCWNKVVTIRNNVATMLQRCVVLSQEHCRYSVWNSLGEQKLVRDSRSQQ